MELVKDINDIIHNTETLDAYLSDPELADYAISLIKRGICFVIVEKNNENKFYPSRFIGYQNNSQVLHSANRNKDGRITNPAISKILGRQPDITENWEAEYQKYCESLGFNAAKTGTYGVKRKFWRL